MTPEQLNTALRMEIIHYRETDELTKHLKMGKNNQQISKELHISAATVIDKFKRKFGITPQQYLKQL